MRQVHALGVGALFMQPTRRCEARGHSTSAEQLVCHYVPDGSAAGHTGVSTTGLGETRSAQANKRPRECLVRAALSVRRGILCAIPSLLFVSLTCGAASCTWRVISNSTRPTARHSRYTSGRSTALSWMVLDRGGSCGYITLRRSIFVYKLLRVGM